MKQTLPNPSSLLVLNEYFDRGLLTEAELKRLRERALRTNAYTGKVKDESN
jgi:hypothetical protein